MIRILSGREWGSYGQYSATTGIGSTFDTNFVTFLIGGLRNAGLAMNEQIVASFETVAMSAK